VVQWAERYLWSDWEFAAALAVLIAADTATGLARAWHTRTLASRRFQGVFVKVLAYAATLVTLHTISHHTVQGQPNSLLAGIVPYFDATAYAAIVLRETLSIHENLAALGYPLLPTRVLRHFRHPAHEAHPD
jgi:phage-related holin